MPVQHSPVKRPITRSQALLLRVENNAVAPNPSNSSSDNESSNQEERSPSPERTPEPQNESNASDVAQSEEGAPGDALDDAPIPKRNPPDMDNAGNNGGNDAAGGAGGNRDAGLRGLPPAMQNWNAFCQALYGHRPPLPEFKGLGHEDPQRYLRKCEEYIESYQIPEGQRTSVIEKGLRGDADKWWQCYKTLDFDWPRFRELLANRFDSDAIKGELIAQLYSKKQGDKESVGAFLQEKYLLFQRVRPNETEANKVSTLVNLVKPSLRKTLRPVTLVDFADLLNRSLQAERDEGEETQNKLKATKPVVSDNKPASQNSDKKTTLPQCWHCPERHFHKDCAIYQAKRGSQSENWRKAADKPASDATNSNDRK